MEAVKRMREGAGRLSVLVSVGNEAFYGNAVALARSARL